MKITNKTVGWTNLIVGYLALTYKSIQIMHQDNWFDSDVGSVAILWIVLTLSGLLFIGIGMAADAIEFEFEIKLPWSNRIRRKTLNDLYIKMGQAAMDGNEKEEKRIWEVIQKIEKAGW